MKNRIDWTFKNDLSEIPRLHESVESFCATHNIPAAIQMNLDLALEEIITNVIKYAFDDQKSHPINVRITIDNNKLTVMIRDCGKLFNPLDQDDADTTSDLESRGIGGLGIHFVKSLMDQVSYDRVDNQNQLTITKNL